MFHGRKTLELEEHRLYLNEVGRFVILRSEEEIDEIVSLPDKEQS